MDTSDCGNAPRQAVVGAVGFSKPPFFGGRHDEEIRCITQHQIYRMQGDGILRAVPEK
jgi:hypothetical protein